MANKLISWINGYQSLGGRQATNRGRVLAGPSRRPDAEGPPGPYAWMSPTTPQYRATMPQPAPQPVTAPPSAPIQPPPTTPWYEDPDYIKGEGILSSNRDRALAFYAQDLASRGKDWGFNVNLAALEDTDPTNDASAIAEDMSNPFNRLATLRKNYDVARRGTSTSMAARGQLYSGALQRQQNFNLENFNRADSQLRGDFGSYVRDLIARRQGARDTYETQRFNLETGAKNRAIQNLPTEVGPEPGPGPGQGYETYAQRLENAFRPDAAQPANFYNRNTDNVRISWAVRPEEAHRLAELGPRLMEFEEASRRYWQRTGQPLRIDDFLRGIR